MQIIPGCETGDIIMHFFPISRRCLGILILENLQKPGVHHASITVIPDHKQ